MQHQVHGRDAQHRRVEVEPVEHAAADMLAVRFQQIAGVNLLSRPGFGVGLLKDPLRRRISLQKMLHGLDQEATGSACRVADHIGGLRFEHGDH